VARLLSAVPEDLFTDEQQAKNTTPHENIFMNNNAPKSV
jgi:hypothetical protein